MIANRTTASIEPGPANRTVGPLSLLTSTETMLALGYKDRGAFWNMVYRESVPHVRLNARVIRFAAAALAEWIRRRSSDVC